MVPDPSSGSSVVAQIILAAGTAGAAIIGALVLWPTRRRRERAAETAATEDGEDRTARLRERLTALETTSKHHDTDIEHLKEVVDLLRAQEVAVEEIARARRQPPRTRT